MWPFLIFLLGSVSIIVSAQDTVIDIHVVKPQQNAKIVIQDEKIFQVVEQMPEYPGGDEAMMKFIRDNIVIPDSTSLFERPNNRVVVGFIVNENGSLSDIAIKRGVSKEMDIEALRVVKLFPKFRPGKQQGKTVKVAFVLPVQFGIPNKPTGPTAKPYDPKKRNGQ